MDIFEAIGNNNINRVKELLESGVDVNSQTEYGDTPLHVACEKNKIEIVKLLLQNSNIDVNVEDEYGNTPLYIACEKNYIEIVKLLLAKSDIEIYFDYNTFKEEETFNWMEDLTIKTSLVFSLKVRSLLKSHTNNYRNSINKILDRIEN